ncbi:hypothetical protein H0H87_009414 [Tephrocybe sp. NHM501043]|nr:hypothetical protein H0H87_009414 [Tephrocybe sp. NHM501043]
MADFCIPSNPDISGVGVRVAIYLQNLLTFAPVVVHLWDRKITDMELKAREGQSVGILSIAFAILISTIIQAKMSSNGGASISSFHAAVILDLSWMNNTSTFVWFLLYAHYRSKATPEEGYLPATWSAWTKAVIRPFNHLVHGVDEATDAHNREKDEGIKRRAFVTVLFKPFRYNNSILLIEVITLLYFAEHGTWDPILDTFFNADGDLSHFSIPAVHRFVLIIIGTIGYPALLPRPPYHPSHPLVEPPPHHPPKPRPRRS